MRDMISRGLALVAVIIAVAVLFVVLFGPSPINHGGVQEYRRVTDDSFKSPERPKVVLDCNRPQGHHRWVADMIVPPTTAKDGTTVRLSVQDAHGNTDNTDIDIKGWLCIIDAEIPKVP